MLLAINGPSASGKTTMMQHLINGAYDLHALPLQRIVTCTTRKPRSGERDGREYHFLSHEDFMERYENGLILERNHYSGNWYGIPSNELRHVMNDDVHGIIVVEFLGYAKLVEYMGLSNVKLVFVNVSPETVRSRLLARDGEAGLDERMAEIRYKDYLGREFASYVLDNEELEQQAFTRLWNYVSATLF